MIALGRRKLGHGALNSAARSGSGGRWLSILTTPNRLCGVKGLSGQALDQDDDNLLPRFHQYSSFCGASCRQTPRTRQSAVYTIYLYVPNVGLAIACVWISSSLLGLLVGGLPSPTNGPNSLGNPKETRCLYSNYTCLKLAFKRYLVTMHHLAQILGVVGRAL